MPYKAALMPLMRALPPRLHLSQKPTSWYHHITDWVSANGLGGGQIFSQSSRPDMTSMSTGIEDYKRQTMRQGIIDTQRTVGKAGRKDWLWHRKALREGNSKFSQATVWGEYFNHQGIRGKPSKPKGQQSKDMLGDIATQSVQSSSHCACRPSPEVVELEASSKT